MADEHSTPTETEGASGTSMTSTTEVGHADIGAYTIDISEETWVVFATSADLEHADDTEVDIDQCVDSLNISARTKSDIKMHLETHGVNGMDTVLMDMLNEYKSLPVNIAVIGRTGSGKSSLINSFRNLRATDPGAARVGAIETTTKIQPYKYPSCNRFILWDIPGVNTELFPRETYLEQIRFPQYDAFIIVCTDRITADDIWLAQEVHTAGKHFYFVRSKIDVDYSNSVQDGFDAEEELLKIRTNLEDCLVRAHLPTDFAFLVSSRLTFQTAWDFPKLTHLLTTQTPQKDEQTMIMSMVSCSKDMISLKRDKLKERIDIVALNASTSPTISGFQEAVLSEIREYTEWFGTTDLEIEKWQVDVAKLDSKLRQIKRMLDDSLRWLKINIKTKQFVLGALGFFLEFFEMSASLKSHIDNLQMKETEEVEKAQRKGSELKRKTAKGILNQALKQCHKLAIGILEARENAQW